MDDKIARYYHEELAYLRRQGSAFAKAHPKTAKQLHLGTGVAEDPFVARLLSSFAFLTSRLRTKIDDERQMLHRILLETLYPHYLLPVPSMATIQLEAKSTIDHPYTIPKGTEIKAETPEKKPCLFTMAYPVTLWPLKLYDCEYKRHFHVKSKYPLRELKSCLSFKLETSKQEISLHHLAIDKLRIHYQFDELAHAYLFHQQLFQHLKSIVITYRDQETQAIELPKNLIQMVGFGPDEHILSYPPHSFNGFCLLTEFFTYPQKFFYMDICQLDKYITPKMGREITIHLLFDQICPDLEHIVDSNMLKLGCTPLVNLFSTSAEPIRLDHRRSEYQIIPDNRQSMESIEIYRILSMSVVNTKNKKSKCLPFYGDKYSNKEEENILYWQGIRKSCQELGEHKIQGTELFVNFSLPDDPQQWESYALITPKAMCINRELPMQIITDDTESVFSFHHSSHELVKKIHCLSRFTNPLYRTIDEHNLSDIVSHLQLNQLSFEDDAIALKALKNTLALYHYQQTEESQWIEEGLTSVKTKYVVERHPDNLKQGFCQGIEFSLEINENFFPRHTVLLFGEILHRYLTRSCTVNSFVKLIITSQQHGEIHRWQAMLGSKTRL